MWTDEDIARRVAGDLDDGSYVNLGIGLPLLVAKFLPPGVEVMLHSENGILGVGPPPPAGEEDWDCVDAGKRPITLNQGGCFFDHALSFTMIRGGHIDVAVLGAFEVSQAGDLANWRTAGKDVIPAVGGAMDLARGARRIYVIMRQRTKDGASRLRQDCSLPLTASGVVTRIYTELCVAEPRGDHFLVSALAPGVSRADVVDSTDAPVVFAASHPVKKATDAA